MPSATRAPTVDDSKPGALAVTSQRPPRSPRMAHLPFWSLVVVNSFGMAVGLTARMVAALMGWPVMFFTVPVSRPTSGCAADGDAKHDSGPAGRHGCQDEAGQSLHSNSSQGLC